MSALVIGLLGAVLGITTATGGWFVLALASALPCLRLPSRETDLGTGTGTGTGGN